LQLARVRFRSPSAADAAVYASLVAAAEGRRVSPGEVAAACESKSGDVRRALLSAQFAASNPRASILIPRKRVSVMALEEPGLAGAASRLIARVDPRVSAAEATAPANAVKALKALTRSASLEDRRAERTAEEAAVRRRAEVVADAAAAKAERAMRNEIRIEKGVLGKARRGSLGLVAAEVVPEADSAQEGDQSEEDAEAKVAAAANAERAASLDAADEEDAPGGSRDADVDGPAAERPRDDWRRAMLELDSLASLAASLSAADAMLRPARATVTGPRKSWADDPKAYQGGSLGDDPDADGAFDPSDKAEECGGSDLAGEPRHTIGGGGDVAKETAAVIDAIAEHACLGGQLSDTTAASNGSEGSPPSASSALKPPAAVSAHGQVPTMAAAAVRLRELAECTGVTCGRGYGRGLGVVGEGNERAFFLARMAKIQEEKERGVGEGGQGRVRRRKKASQYLQVGADVARELAVLGTFGV
jgi:chemotaxis protein histidine kinase CheA